MPAPHAESAPGAAEMPSARSVVQVMRGFTFIFWGLPLTLLLYFQALDIRSMEQLRLPSYILGMGIITAGFVLILRSGVRFPNWKRYARHGLVSSFLLIYLGPFVYWYRYMPRVGIYYLLNSIFLVVCIIWLLFAINWLASELGRIVGEITLERESRMFGWSVGLMMMAPLLIIFAFSSVMAMKDETSLLSEMRMVKYESPPWIQILFLLPISLTMMSSWKGKERCLKILRGATLHREMI